MEINNDDEDNVDEVFNITDTETIENETNNDDSEENYTSMDRIINGLEDMN